MNQDFIKTSFSRLVIFGILMIFIAFVFNAISPNGIPIFIKKNTIMIGDESHIIPIFKARKEKVEQSKEIYEITSINLEQARELFHHTEPLFIDARSLEEYKIGHIPGALNVPVEFLESFELDLINLDPEQTFVCYCNDPDCDLSLEVAMWLEEQGFTNILYFPAGWISWIEAGNQISTGVKP